MDRARPIFGRPETGRPAPSAPAAGYAGAPLMVLCTEPSPSIVARGWPCHRCIANVAAPGEPARCHFLTLTDERGNARAWTTPEDLKR